MVWSLSLAACFLIFLLAQKEAKKAPTNENSPFVGCSPVDPEYYCKLIIGISMLSPDRLNIYPFSRAACASNDLTLQILSVTMEEDSTAELEKFRVAHDGYGGTMNFLRPKRKTAKIPGFSSLC